MAQSIETVIIGAGQAGLSASYCLTRLGREHVILERSDAPGSAWRYDRWDSFTLVTPNWSVRLPGGYQGADPHGYMSRSELIAYFDAYAVQNHLPIQYNTSVFRVERSEAGYALASDQGDWMARNVIVATGLYQLPKIPAWSDAIPGDVLQIASGKYRNPGDLPAGAVLVVGSGQTGCQIAEELYQSGRKVFLSVGSVGRAPRRYRGKDTYDWLNRARFFDRTPDMLPSPRARFAGNPQLTGKNGGHSLNLHQFYRDGVRLLGRLTGFEEGLVQVAADLQENLARVDQFEVNLTRLVDAYIQNNQIEAPEERLAVLTDAYRCPESTSLNLVSSGISTVIWATGYNFDFSMVRLPVLDGDGFPISQRGVTMYPGLYFLGMPWLGTQKSGLLLGVGEDAEFIASQIAGQAHP